MENFEAGVELEEKRFAGAVEMIRHMQRAWCQRTKYLDKKMEMNRREINADNGATYIFLSIFNHDENGTLELVHLSVEWIQWEAVLRCAED